MISKLCDEMMMEVAKVETRVGIVVRKGYGIWERGIKSVYDSGVRYQCAVEEGANNEKRTYGIPFRKKQTQNRHTLPYVEGRGKSQNKRAGTFGARFVLSPSRTRHGPVTKEGRRNSANRFRQLRLRLNVRPRKEGAFYTLKMA